MIIPVEHWENSSFDGSKNGMLKKKEFSRKSLRNYAVQLEQSQSWSLSLDFKLHTEVGNIWAWSDTIMSLFKCARCKKMGPCIY